MARSIQEIKQVAEQLMEARRKVQPELPWDSIIHLVSYIAAERPDVILIFVHQVFALVLQSKPETYPLTISYGELAGYANPLLVELRAKLKELDGQQS